MYPQKKPIINERQEELLLIDRWYDGEEDAFFQLYHKYYGKAIAYCISLSKDREVSKEITQLTFTRIARKVSSKRGDKIEHFKHYLFASLTKNYLEYARHNERQEAHRQQAKIISMPEASEDAHIKRYLDKDILSYILSHLNEQQQKVFTQQLEGYEVEEIAEMNEMTSGQVRGLLYRSRKKFRQKRKVISEMIFGRVPKKALEP